MRYLIALLLWACSIYANDGFVNVYDYGPNYYDTWHFNNRAHEILKRSHKTIFPDSPFFSETPTPSGNVKSTRAPIKSPNRPSATALRALYFYYPTIPRPEAKRVFIALYRLYAELEKKLGIPKYDVAGAIAAVIAANYMAYTNTEVPDADFLVLVNQTREALRANNAFAKLKANQKRALYEQLAILGMFTAAIQISLQQQPNADYSFQFQEASRANLEGLLGVSATRVTINASGLLIQ